MNWFKSFWKALTMPMVSGPRVIVPPRERIISPRAATTSPAFSPAAPASPANFTPLAQQVLALARQEADRFNHNFVGTEHLLLGIIKLGQGVAVNVLQKMSLDLAAVRDEVEKQVGTGPDQKMVGNIPYTPRVKRVLALAAREAAALCHTYVGTEHILIGLLLEGDGVAARVLRNLDVDIETTRLEVLKELDPNFSEACSTTEPVPTTPRAPLTAALSAASARQLSPDTDALSHFTPRAQQVLALARMEADRFRHHYVGSEHLLIGLLVLGQGVAVHGLKKKGLVLQTVRSEVEKQSGTGSGEKAIGNIPYTQGAKKVFALAAKEVRALRHTYLATEHILLGLLQENDGAAVRVLQSLGVNVEEMRQDILRELESNPNPEPAPSTTALPSTKSTVLKSTLSPQPQPEAVDISKRYDVSCTDWSQGMTVYRNVRFKSLKHLFHRHQYDVLSGYVELELSDGQAIFVSRSSIIKFCEHGTTPGPGAADPRPQ